MTLTIELAPEVEERLQQEATRHGVPATDYARRLIEEGLQTPLTEKQKATLALLQSWVDQDATDDPEEIRAAEAELEAFKQAMNENRAGESPLYP
jgi:predicted transcriptional regulator